MLFRKFGDKFMNFDKNVPIYIQVMDYIRLGIINGNFNSNGKLPSTREMAKALKLNTNTINRAYYTLVLDGIIHTKRGVGYFVAYDKKTIANLKNAETNKIVKLFICEIKELNFSSSEILSLIRNKLNK